MTEAAAEDHWVTAEEEDGGRRLDVLLSRCLPALSRSRLKQLIEGGRVTAQQAAITAPSYRVKPGERFLVAVPAVRSAAPRGQALALDVVYEDAELIVVDKPAGLVVHPAPGHPDRTLVNALIAHCGDSLAGIGGVRRPGIVHRLDKDTSGLMVAAKTAAAHASLTAQFAARRIERSYAALVWGVPAPATDEISGNIGRSPHNRKKMAVVAQGGRPAVTRYRVRQVLAGGLASLVDCRLLTGRTHQIRVHLSARGHPVIGDPLYGRATARRLAGLPEPARTMVRNLDRQALHAEVLGFNHPATGERVKFSSQLPAKIIRLKCCLEEF